jgi:hypothetical protein
VSVLEAFGAATVKEVDVEDLLDPALYEALVRESYSSELKGKTMTLNANIPRIAKRVESALGDLGIEFHKANVCGSQLRTRALLRGPRSPDDRLQSATRQLSVSTAWASAGDGNRGKFMRH